MDKAPDKENPQVQAAEIDSIKKAVLQLEGVERLLTDDEMRESGFGAPSSLYPTGALFGIGAKEGRHFGDTHYEKGSHGYTVNRPHYGTFCAVNKKIAGASCTSILDVTKLAAAELGVSMD